MKTEKYFLFIATLSLLCGCITEKPEETTTTLITTSTTAPTTSSTTTTSTTSTTTPTSTSTTTTTTITSSTTSTQASTTTTTISSKPDDPKIQCRDVRNPSPKTCGEAVCDSGRECTYRPAGGGCCGLPPICTCK